VAILRGLAKPVRYAALAAGALPVLAFPAANLEFLAWCGLVPGMLLIRAAPARREAAVRGWWLGTGYLLAALYWLTPELGPGLLLVGAVFGVLWAPMAIALWSLLRPPVSTPRALAALVVVPSYWLLIEWIRSWQALGGPWAVLGASQWQHPVILALAAVGGVWLVSFALVAANTGIVIVLVAGRAGLRLIGGAVVAATLAAGPVAFALTPPAPPGGRLTVALVQPGMQKTLNGASLRLTSAQAGLLRASHAGLVVWGESSVSHLSPALLAQVRTLSAAVRAGILVNQDSWLHGKHTKVAVLVGPRGIEGQYTKTRLVPFGEYIPFRQALSWLTSISRAAAVNMNPGTGAHDLTVPTADGQPFSIGVLICFESAFPDMARVDTDQGARVIVYQTSDTTFTGTWAVAQHASLGALRAAETGRPVVQAALTGDTAAFDARGRLLSWMSESRSGIDIVHLTLPAAASRTPYDLLGDFMPWVAVGIAAAAAALAFARSGGGGRGWRLLRIPWVGNHRGASDVPPSVDAPRSGVLAGSEDDTV
jgi:apolipoprotein N-acyltransferase